jgi:membrane protein DedA with SNARE-associated domain
MEKLRELMEEARSNPGLLEYSLLGMGAMVEYVFPPFPGDVVVLLGAFLVGKYHWSLPLVLVAVNVGSAIGLSADYAFGRWVGKRDRSWREKYPRWQRMGASIDRFDVFYRRWGALCIVLNRFVPAIRAVFFVAAGMAGIKYWKALVLGLVSSLAWTWLLVLAGAWVGGKWDKLKALLQTYSVAAWIAAALVVALLVLRYFSVRRRKGTGAPSAPTNGSAGQP